MPNSSEKGNKLPVSVIRELEQLLSGPVETDVGLSEISRWRIGGIADVIVRPRTFEELINLRSWLNEKELPYVVVGAASNLLFSDKGLRAICIQIGKDFSSSTINETTISAESGIFVPLLSMRAMRAGLSGLEHVCGIPGTLGGLICMNGGSQRKSIGNNIEEVISINKEGRLVRRNRNDCEFSNRHSVFQANEEIIIHALIKLSRDIDKSVIRRNMLNIFSNRRNKYPMKLPNCGSVFISDPELYKEYGTPGEVIERLGLLGLQSGGAMVSSLHGNFIVNTGKARAADVLYLINIIRKKVLAATGIQMKTEVRFVAESGKVCPGHEVLDVF